MDLRDENKKNNIICANKAIFHSLLKIKRIETGENYNRLVIITYRMLTLFVSFDLC